MGTDVVKNVNKNNASHAVLFEALALVSIYWVYELLIVFISSKLVLNFLFLQKLMLHLVKIDGLASCLFFFNKLCLHVYLLTGHASGCWKGDDVTVCCSSWEVYCSPGTKYSVPWSGNRVSFQHLLDLWPLLALLNPDEDVELENLPYSNSNSSIIAGKHDEDAASNRCAGYHQKAPGSDYYIFEGSRYQVLVYSSLLFPLLLKELDGIIRASWLFPLGYVWMI